MHDRPSRPLPAHLTALYAEMVARAWRGGSGSGTGGSVHRRRISGRDYWYWQPRMERGRRRPAKSLGPDGPESRRRAEAIQQAAAELKDRITMVRALRAARLPTPSPLTAAILQAMSDADVFKEGGLVLGEPAHQSYPALFGLQLPRPPHVGFDGGLVLILEQQPEIPIEFTLKGIDRGFAALPFPADAPWGRHYRLTRATGTFTLEVIGPLSLLRGRPAYHQLLTAYDALSAGALQAAALSGAGIPLRVPAPEDLALHLLQMAALAGTPWPERQHTLIAQTIWILDLALTARPAETARAWDALWAGGKARRHLLTAGYRRLSEEMRARLREALADHGDPLTWSAEDSRNQSLLVF